MTRGARPEPVRVLHVVQWLNGNGYRPERARSLPGHPGWGAPEWWEAACPLCHVDGALRVEEWDRGAITFCANDACPSWEGATTEQHVHDAVWAALVDRGMEER